MAIKRKTINLIVNGNALTPVDAATGLATTDAGVQGENEAVWLHADVPADWQDLVVRIRVMAMDGAFDESLPASNGTVDLPLRQNVTVAGRLVVTLVGLSEDGDTGNYLVRKSIDCRTLLIESSDVPTDPASYIYPQSFETFKKDMLAALDSVNGYLLSDAIKANIASIIGGWRDDGTLKGIVDPAIEEPIAGLFNNSNIISDSDNPSWVGIKNYGYTADSGTRLYLIPKGVVTTGTGAALKLFADPYDKDTANYRDFGVFFAADLNGDTGQHGIGAYYLNAKTGGSYNGKYTDIIFGWQDGQVRPMRLCTILNHDASAYEGILVLGSAPSSIASLLTGVCCEIQKNVITRNNVSFMWANSDASAVGASIRLGDDNRFKFSFTTGFDLAFSGNITVTGDASNINVNENVTLAGAIKTTKTWTVTSNLEVGDVTNFARVIFNQPSANVITSLGGVDGQKITILFQNANTTIANVSTIKLAGATNFVAGANDTMTLENINGVWYETSRSVNH